MLMWYYNVKNIFSPKNGVKIVKQKNKSEIEYICPKCKAREMIPTNIVEMLDAADQIGVDISIPPRFDCQRCNGKMVPIYYIGVKGRIYEYKEK